ncbi:MAG TPA: FAD-dependent oxidoreductase [Solirubrobacteraceae bacterium]|nr:FAD-dependent oxidoreductase [Solirubrobacteraceae bacterium]
MSDRKTFVIVGGGLAAAKAAETLREEGFDGRIVVVAEEDRLPYERPPLSKSYLAGESPFSDAVVHDEAFYGERDVELLRGSRAAALDPGARAVTLADGGRLEFDRLLIATGALPKRPPIEGADGERVLTLRSVADADAIKAAVAGGGRLVIVGGGWIGCEVAASARGLGASVTVVEQAGTPLEAVLGPRLGAFFGDLHRSHGVELLTGAGVERITDGGRGVALVGGRTVEADAVLLAVGVAPATALAESAELAVDDGILVDELLRTSADDVFAAGDVASMQHARYGRIRVEHWDNAIGQGQAAARSMLGNGEPYAKLPYFFTDQYDLGMEYVGHHGRSDELTIRGSLEDSSFRAYWTAPDGHITAAMHVNDWDAIDPMRELVETGGALPVG